jgi:methionine-rich copper-binding protein CopC
VAVDQLSRYTGSGLAPGRYTIKDPWGTVSSCTADAAGKMDCRIAARRITSFLHGTGRNVGFVGNGVAATTFVGSPTGFNKFLITGPAGFRASASRSVLTGKKLPNTAMSSMTTTKALSFGSITKARPSVATIPVSSFGSAPLRVTTRLAGANPRAFTVTNGCASVASGSACTIGVRYAPTANRNASAVLTIDDDGLAAPRKVTLSGVANDTRAPKVLSSTPARGAANVAAGKSLKVKFSEAVVSAKSGLSLVDAAGNKVGAKVARVGKTNTYLLNPGRALAHGAKYTVKVNGGKKALRDLAGNAAKDTQWSFRTR